MKYDIVIAGAGPAGIAAASVMCKTKTTTPSVDVTEIRKHLIDRGVCLDD